MATIRRTTWTVKRIVPSLRISIIMEIKQACHKKEKHTKYIPETYPRSIQKHNKEEHSTKLAIKQACHNKEKHTKYIPETYPRSIQKHNKEKHSTKLTIKQACHNKEKHTNYIAETYPRSIQKHNKEKHSTKLFTKLLLESTNVICRKQCTSHLKIAEAQPNC